MVGGAHYVAYSLTTFIEVRRGEEMMESRDELVLGDERVSEGVAAGEEEMTIMPLGGGQEVGRSCILLKYRGRTVMLDCGNHPGREGE